MAEQHFHFNKRARFDGREDDSDGESSGFSR